MEDDVERKEWMKVELMMKLLKEMTAEYKKETYEVNKVARAALDELGEDRHEEGSIHSQVITFCHLLGSAPRYYV
jgi:hypothetical protein